MTLRPDIHVALVSDRATANVTPALDPDFRPREVVLVVGPRFRRQGAWLEDVLRPAGVAVSTWEVRDVWDVEHLRERMLELVAQRDGQGLALNVSGGTKPMGIAAYEVFRAFDKPIFFVHPHQDRVVWMHPAGQPPRELADHIKLGAFLRAHGALVQRQGEQRGVPENRRALTAALVDNVEALARSLATLNWLANRAEDTLVSPHLDGRQKSDRALGALIEMFEREGLVAYQGGRLRFADEAARFFVNGGWLEDHVYATLFGLRRRFPVIQDVGRSVEVTRDGDSARIPNELDVAFLADNRFYLIECKTRRWAKEPTADSPGAETLYKLDTLKDLLGGLHGQAMLVSYHELSPPHRQRARDLGLATCCGGRIRQLERHLEAWLEKG